ncbi:Pumilio y domain member 6 [Coemansia sp. RSA 2049]|nr:Pumilio y domain member 6 [Coemansia sp. RSA 2049]
MPKREAPAQQRPKQQSKYEGKGKNRNNGEDDPSSRGQQQKRQRVERQKQQATGELKLEARKKWEELRRGDLDPEVRKAKMQEMMALIQGRIKEITFKHDMSRVVQTCLKYGSSSQRASIAEELDGTYLELSRSTYGRHILVRLLKYCPKQRRAIIGAFYGHVRRLVRHKDAAPVLEECYAVYANAAQRWDLVAEFYGNEFAVFKDGGAEGGLEAVLAAHPQKRATILGALRATVVPLLEKGTVQHSIVHRALLDYIRHADAKERQEVVETMRELVVEILHTREGAQAGMLCLLHGTPKDRKAIVKAMKPYLRKICCEEHGYAVLVEALDCVDDTVFMAKAVLQDVGDMVGELLGDQYGRRVPLYVLAGRNAQYVGREALRVLAAGDAVRAATSKKDAAQRQRELRASFVGAMARWVAANARAAVFEPLLSQAVAETLVHEAGAPGAAWAAVRALLAADEQTAMRVLTDAVANRVVTTGIKARDAYARDVLEALAADGAARLRAAACAGAFPVRALLEAPATAQRTRQLLAGAAGSIRDAMAGAERKRTFEAILAGL